jgi:hypothetical protein
MPVRGSDGLLIPTDIEMMADHASWIMAGEEGQDWSNTDVLEYDLYIFGLMLERWYSGDGFEVPPVIYECVIRGGFMLGVFEFLQRVEPAEA